MKAMKVMQKIIAVLIITYTLGSFFTTIGDLVAIKDVQAATVQPEQPTHQGNGSDKRWKN